MNPAIKHGNTTSVSESAFVEQPIDGWKVGVDETGEMLPIGMVGVAYYVTWHPMTTCIAVSKIQNSKCLVVRQFEI